MSALERFLTTRPLWAVTRRAMPAAAAAVKRWPICWPVSGTTRAVGDGARGPDRGAVGAHRGVGEPARGRRGDGQRPRRVGASGERGRVGLWGCLKHNGQIRRAHDRAWLALVSITTAEPRHREIHRC